MPFPTLGERPVRSAARTRTQPDDAAARSRRTRAPDLARDPAYGPAQYIRILLPTSDRTLRNLNWFVLAPAFRLPRPSPRAHSGAHLSSAGRTRLRSCPHLQSGRRALVLLGRRSRRCGMENSRGRVIETTYNLRAVALASGRHAIIGASSAWLAIVSPEIPLGARKHLAGGSRHDHFA